MQRGLSLRQRNTRDTHTHARAATRTAHYAARACTAYATAARPAAAVSLSGPVRVASGVLRTAMDVSRLNSRAGLGT